MSSLVEGWVLSWADDAEAYAGRIEKLCRIKCSVLKMYADETSVLNTALSMCASPYCWLLTNEQVTYPETPHVMVEWMQGHDDVGVMCPNREGEPPGTPRALPYRKYLADNTAIMVRRSVGARFDDDFKFTGWSDLDYGLEVEWRGYAVQIETRVSVIKGMTPYGSWSSYRRAINAANRLLLEAKWYWVGRKAWRSHAYYNRYQAHILNLPRIPTIYELCCLSNDELDAFCDSVNHEHPQIQKGIDGRAGNEDWKWPNTR